MEDADLTLGLGSGQLEVRDSRRGTRLAGRFPYNSLAVLSDGGRTGKPRKEAFASRAFEYRIADPKAEIHLLSGHDYGQVLARKLDDSLILRDADEALTFEANIAPELTEAPFFQNLIAQLRAGLIGGISPGFRLPPERAVPREQAEETTEEAYKPERGMFGAMIRWIKQALLFELSLVTVPAYSETSVEARSEGQLILPEPKLLHHAARWR